MENNIICRMFIFFIRFYQNGISIILPYNQCKFYPSCSEYSIEAIKKYGTLLGMWISIKRMMKCHPYSKSGGFDQVP